MCAHESLDIEQESKILKEANIFLIEFYVHFYFLNIIQNIRIVSIFDMNLIQRTFHYFLETLFISGKYFHC